MKTFNSDQFEIPITPNNRYPIEKTPRVRDFLLEREIFANQYLHVSEPSRDQDILLSHQLLSGDWRSVGSGLAGGYAVS